MKKYFLKKPSVLVILFTIISVSWVNFNQAKWNSRSVVEWDIVSYYAYLPAVFIENDIKMSFIGDKAKDYNDKHMYTPYRAANGNYLVKTTMGMSLLYSPFFFIGHLSAHLFGYETTGFSPPYQFMLQFSALFYLVIALIFLRKVLLNFFTEGIVAMTFVCLVGGTNLFYYASIGGPMTHTYMFCMDVLILYFTLQWHKHPGLKNSLCLGLFSGLMLLIRPVDGLVLLFFVLYNVKDLSSLKANVLLFVKNIKYLLVIGITMFLCFVPQFLYWKYVAGEYLYFGYIGAKFYFGHPHLIEGLFGFRKGWLLYTPIMIFSLIGLYNLYRQQKQLVTPIILIFCVFTYVILSWWCWWYGGSFGQRGMIDIYPLLSLPLAAFIYDLSKAPLLKVRIGFSVLVLLILLNVVQTMQYRWNIIHYDSMTKEAYVEAFLRLTKSKDRDKLLKAPDYDKAFNTGEE